MNRRDKKVSKITVKTIKKALFKQNKLLFYLMENKNNNRNRGNVMQTNLKWTFKNELLTKLIVVVVTGILAAVSLNIFLIPANVFSAGLNGIAQLVSGAFDMYLGMTVNTGILIFVLNIPIFLISWLKLGKEATVYSFLTVVSMSVFTMIIPQYSITDNVLLNTVAGGVVVGLGAGLCLVFGFTTGGLDIIALVVAKTTGKTVGSLLFLQNLLIILVSGLMYDWETALYTIISIFCLTQIVDKMHTGSQKMTAFIISAKSDEIKAAIHSAIPRGMTLLPGRGGFTNQENTVIMMVVSKYELYDLEKLVYEIDEKAFVNIVPTQSVMGQFLNEDEQREHRKALQTK